MKKRVLLITLALTFVLSLAMAAGCKTVEPPKVDDSGSSGFVDSSDSSDFSSGSSGVEECTHSFTQEVVKDGALKAAATCTQKAVYFKSCSICGAVSTSDEDTFESGDLAEHSFTKSEQKAAALKSEATCEDPKTYYKSCSVCGTVGKSATFTVGEALGHDFSKGEKEEIVNDETLKSEATCQSPAIYKYTCTCDRCEKTIISETDTFENGGKAAHSYVTYNTDNAAEGALKSEATCQSPAVYKKICEWCKTFSESETEVFTSGDALPHDFTKEEVSDKTRKSAATCAQKAVYFKSCVCGAISTSDEDTFESGVKLAHAYTTSTKSEATCTAAKVITYTCSCGDTYDKAEGDPLGHDVANAEVQYEETSTKCQYKEYRICARESCGEKVYGAEVYRHTYTASITTAATCTEEGVKTLTCSVCKGTEIEEIDIDTVNGHNWTVGTVTDGKKTDTCSLCNATKDVIVSEENNSTVSADDLSSNEIALKDASFNFGNALGETSGNLTLGLDKAEGDKRKDLGLSDEMLKQVGDNPIYDFTLEGSDGEKISSFGEDNYVTITIPYTLAEGEDVDNIAVWYINDDGKLESIKATYNNGFISFKTNHFSYYTVTRLTPKERCALYGHSYGTMTKVEGGCLGKTYDLKICIRCHERLEENVKKAPGHDGEVVTTPATCTQSGSETFKCKNCSYSYTNVIPAIGHDYALKSDEKATCEKEGVKTFACKNEGCDSTYTQTLPKAEHVLTSNKVAPTCGSEGYTEYSCENCDYNYKTNYVKANGHEYDYDDPEKTVWDFEGYAEGSTAYAGASASVAFHCVNCDHCENLVAAVSVKLKYGACSNYFKVTFTAAVTFEGAIRSKEFVFSSGDADHKFSDKYKHDEKNHWHECICGERQEESIAAHEFANPVVKKKATCGKEGELLYTCVCGATKTEVIPATGEHSFKDGVCTICGNSSFYTNLFESSCTVNGLTVTIENFVLNNVYIVNGEVKLEEWVEQVGIVYLTLYFEDGELKGEGKAKVIVNDDTFDCEAYIENGYVYFSVAQGNGENELKDGYLGKASVEALADALIESMFGSSAPIVSSDLREFIEIYNEAIAAVKTLIKTQPEKAEKIISSLFDIVYKREKTASGYKFTLDYDKLYALNDNLANKTIAEVIDVYFGNGSFDELYDCALSVLALTPNELYSALTDADIDTEGVIAILNKYLGFTDSDIKAFFENYGETAVGDFLLGENYVDVINENVVSMLKERSLYALLSGFVEGAEEVRFEIDRVLNEAEGALNITVVSNSGGKLLEVNCGVNGFMSGMINGDLGFVIEDGNPELALGDIVGKIEDILVDPDEDRLKFDEWILSYYQYDAVNGSTEIEFAGESYTASHWYDIYYRYVNSPSIHLASPDCKNWICYNINCDMVYCLFDFYSTENGELFLSNGGKVIKIEVTESGITATHSDGTVVTLSEIQLPAESEYELKEDYYLAVFKAYLNSVIGFDFAKSYCTAYDESEQYASYYYNTETKEYSYSYSSRHDYQLVAKEFLSTSNSCEDGVVLTYKCAYCGDSYKRTIYWHDTESVIIDLKDKGFCSVYLVENRCAACGTTITDRYFDRWEGYGECSFEWTGNTEQGYEIYTCQTCGCSYYTEQIRSEKDENCKYTVTWYYIFVNADGEEVYRYVYDRSAYYVHSCKYEFILNGETCEEGYTVKITCLDCDYSSEKVGTSHTIYTIFTLSNGKWCNALTGEQGTIDCCEGEYLSISRCPCGYMYGINGICESCFTCGLTFEQSTDTTEKGTCVVNKKWHICVGFNGATLYEYENKGFDSFNHSYSVELVTDEEDGTYVKEVCSVCGDERCSPIYLQNVYDLSENGTFEFTFTAENEKNNYIFLFDERIASINIFDAEGNFAYERYNGWCLSVPLEVGEYNVVVSSYSGRDKVGLIVLGTAGVVDQLVRDGIYCMHDNRRASDLLLGDSCEDGVIDFGYCAYCGAVAGLNLSYEHEVCWRELDLSQFGACEGSFSYVSYYGCACGKVVGRYNGISLACNYNSSSTTYTDGKGKLIHVEERTCKTCGLFYQCSYYDVLDYGNCKGTHYYTVIVKVGDNIVFNYDYTGIYTQHDYVVTYELLGGEGSSCNEGVIITYTCKTCGNSYYDNIGWHRQVIEEKIDLSEYGCVCGGYAVISRCPCGESVSFSLSEALCEFDEVYYDRSEFDELLTSSLEKTLNEGEEVILNDDYWQYNSSGDMWLERYAYVYTCAVTDPKACGFKMVRAYYYVREKGECVTYRYESWLCYDSAAKEYKFIYSRKYDEVCQWHNYGEGKSLETNDGTVYTCQDCGSTYTERWYQEEDGTSVDERIAINTKYQENGFNQSYSYVHKHKNDAENDTEEYSEEYRYVHNDGTVYIESNINKYFYRNGFEYQSYYKYVNGDYWHCCEYTYDFSNLNGEGCVRTCKYTNSNGSEEITTENCCKFELNAKESVTKMPTCTQEGSASVACIVCGMQKTIVLERLGHCFVRLENGNYFCTGCGLQNENGADGSVSLEDLTSSLGNGENYVVGYYDNSGVKFNYYVCLVLHSDPDKEIILEGVEFTELSDTLISFSKAQVEELALAKGYESGSYDVRLVFVPEAIGGGLDYAITLTQEEPVTEITESCSFVGRLEDGTVTYTVTPSVSGVWSFTPAFCGGSYNMYFCDGELRVTLSDEDGNQLAYGSGFFKGKYYENLLMTCELEAGKSYTLNVEVYVYDRNYCYFDGFEVFVDMKIFMGTYVGVTVTAPND